MLTRPMLRVLAISALSVTMLGCASDDPAESVDPDAGPDCLGNPTADPATFPPAPDEEIPRPDDKIIDLRGEERVEIAIADNAFETRWLRVDPCTELVFTNRGANPHNVVSAAAGAFPTIEQDALLAAPQALVVASPGDYPFYCSIHGTPTRGQTGFLVVGDG